MNHCVPDFEMDGDCSLPSLTRPRKSNLVAGDEIMELLWQNGPVVMQSQRSGKKSEHSEYGGYEPIAADQATPSAILNQTYHNHQQQQQQNLFMQEDEMASWLHYPLNDTSFVADFCPDLLYPSPCVNVPATAAAATTSTVSAANATRTAPVVAELRQPPPPKPPMPMAPPRRFENFGHFSWSNRPRVDESGPSISSRATNESTVVDSSGTPAMGLGSRVSEAMQYDVSRGTVDAGAAALSTSPANGGGREMVTCELTVTSSPGASSACAEPPPPQKSSTLPPPPPPPSEDRKRKGIEIDAEADDDECHSEDVELESADTKKQARGSTSSKRSRAAEVHNLSERRRRDRINEKMRALQELIPHCNKADKASMLDEAIDYLKSLQMQVQMMSMGCSVIPMMFPGVHQYMPHMGMGIGMAMGMGMDMGMSRPILPFPNMLSGSAVPTPTAGAHLGPRFPIPTFHMPHVPAPDPSRISPTVQSDPLLSSPTLPSQNQARIPNFIDPYQQYFGLRHMQLPLQQNQTPSGTSKPSTSKVGGNLENPPSG